MFLSVLFLLGSGAGGARGNWRPEPLWEKRPLAGMLNEPVCADVDFDGALEIVLSSREGNVAVLEAATGRKIWSRKLEGAFLFSPVLGQFVNKKFASPEIACLDKGGRLRVLRANDGEILFDGVLEGEAVLFQIDPSLLPGRSGVDNEFDSLVVVDSERVLYNLAVTPLERKLVDLWAGMAVRDLGDMPVHPVSIGRVAAPEGLGGEQRRPYAGVFSTASNKVVAFSALYPDRKASSRRLTEERGFQPCAIFRQSPGDGLCRDVFVSGSAQPLLHFGFEDLPEAASLWSLEMSGLLRVSDPFCPIEVSDLNGDGVGDLVLYGPSQMVVVDGLGGAPFLDRGDFELGTKELLPKAGFFETAGASFLVVGDIGSGVQLIDLGRLDGEAPRFSTPGISSLALTSPLVLDAEGDGFADVFVQKEDSTVLMLATTLRLASGAGIAWPTAQGSGLRGGGRPRLYERETQAVFDLNLAELRDNLQAGAESLERGEYREALGRVGFVLSLNPRHPEARKIFRRAYVRENLFQIVVYSFAGFVICAIVLLAIWGNLSSRFLFRHAIEMAEGGKHVELIAAFKRHFWIYRWQSSMMAKFAELCRKYEIMPEGMTDFFEKGYKKSPDDRNIVAVLAALYLLERNMQKKAVALYEGALSILKEEGTVRYDEINHSFSGPAPYEEILGIIHEKAQRLEKARVRLESAYRKGVRSPGLFNSLARTYLKLNLIKPRYLPVLEIALKHRPTDPFLLEGLAKCYVMTGLQKDPKSQDVFQRLAQVQPDSALANQEIAAHCYWEGEYEGAEAAALKALEAEPANTAALRVLAWCLWQRKEMSDMSKEIYRRGLEHFPEDTLLLRAMGEMTLESGSPDEAKCGLLIRAVDANENDRSFLRNVADISVRWYEGEKKDLDSELLKNPESLLGRLGLEGKLAQHVLERLYSIEALSDSQTLTLAEIFVLFAVEGPDGLYSTTSDDKRVSEILGRAYSLESDGALLPLLGSSLVRLNRFDPRYEGVFTTLTEIDPEQALWVIHLAQIHLAREHYEDMSRVLHGFADLRPEFGADLPTEPPSGSTSAPQTTRSMVQRLLAIAHANLQEFAKAVDHYQTLLQVNPDDPQVIIGLGQAYARMDHCTEPMREAIAQALSQAPDDPLLNFAHGKILVEGSDWSEGCQCFLNSLKAEGEYVDLVMNQVSSMVQDRQGRVSLPARWLRVQILLGLKRYEDIVEETEAIYSLDSEQHKRIQALFEHILKTDASNLWALFGRGRMLMRGAYFPQARRCLEEALQRDADHLPTKRVLVEVYEELLRHDQSAANHFALAGLAMDLQDYDRAVSGFQKARLDLGFQNVSIRSLAECFFRKGMLDLSLQEYLNVAVDDLSKPLIYDLAEALECAGNILGARMAYEHIYSVDAGYADVANRLNNLTQASGGGVASSSTGSPASSSISPSEKERILSDLGETAKTRYDLRDQIGHGAMSSVYQAYDKELDEVVALKILPESLLKNPEALRRFRLEARSSRRLSHNHIVRIHDIGEEQGRKYISMELVEGSSLKEILLREREEKGPLPGFLRYANQIAHAIQYAHEAGIVHRDLKPANILITKEDNVKVADFGIAKAIAETDKHKTLAGAVVGTPLYMSPEQVLGQPCDPRADIYAFGILLYELVSGKAPFFEGDLAYQHLHTTPPPLPDDTDPVLVSIILKSLSKNREDRWASFTEIIEQLKEVKTAPAS